MSAPSCLVIKDLAEEVSAHCRAANRLLIGVLTVSFIAAAGDPQMGGDAGPVEMPLVGVKVPPSLFFPSALVILALLMIAFASAQMQVHLALAHTHRKIDKAGNEGLREDFDRAVVGTLSRVAPLDQALKHEGLTSLRARRLVYGVLKVVYWGVAFFLPVIALSRCITRIENVTLPMRAVYWAVYCVSVLLFLTMLVLEIKGTWRRLRNSQWW